ncbi:DUF2779 domain-containing protein [Sporocytophaga myxococcoides]|uniref:DUF2779 domain-containing protein n=1 Tax=Sporocytophaga myxococcoides TaxID=153721 RepID=UPI0004029280|nr:DUF2779 domain-containing protein [Sporocytophaga myxococcoides]
MENKNDKAWLSESVYTDTQRCIKSTFLSLHEPELKINTGFSASHTFQIVEKTARTLYPNGIDVMEEEYINFNHFVYYTKHLLDKGNKTIYQACFQSEFKRCKVDILIQHNEKKWTIINVVSRTKVEDTDILRLGFISKTIQELYPKISLEAKVIYLNSNYVRENELDLQKLFNSEDISRRINLVQPIVDRFIRSAIKMYNATKPPNIGIGTYCQKPFPCPFQHICWKDIPEYSVFDLSHVWLTRQFQFYQQGIVKLEDIPRTAKLSENQWMQIDCELQKIIVTNLPAIDKFMEELEYPISHMDFETFQPAIPLFPGTSPYDQIPFQFSVHTEYSNGDVIHHEFLHNGKSDPRLLFLQKLLTVVGAEGTILCYNHRFETARLKELAMYYPEYGADIMRIIDRIKDLMYPFEKRFLYHPEQKGSVSLKVVLPAWAPDLNYKGLSIGNGVAASAEYEKLGQSFTSAKEKAKIRKDLLEYCKMDTYAMVRLLKVLKSLIQKEELVKIKS